MVFDFQRNHLRIGNVLKSCEEYILVAGIPEQGNIQINGYPHIHSRPNSAYGIQPVLITTEILTQCGFTETGLAFEESRHIPGLFILEENGRWLMRLNNMYISKKPMKYLHQLQNLYFALTENEIEFRPEG